MRTIQFELLRENPKALQFLHEAKRFDFEKDFLILKLENSFTFNSVTKEIKKHITGDFSAALLLKANSDYCRDRDLYFVNMGSSKFYPLRDDRSLPYWNYNIDWFFGVGDFEDVRKKKTDHVYVIAQKTELLSTKKEKTTDFSQRFKLVDIRKCGDGRGNSYISELTLIKTDGTGEKVKFTPHPYKPVKEYINDAGKIIDKSGYILTLQRDDLKRRAAALKADREKATFLESDFSTENILLHESVNEIKKLIAEKTLAAATYDDASKLDSAIHKLRWLFMDLENHDKELINKTFSSVTATENSFKSIRKTISEITDILKEGK